MWSCDGISVSSLPVDDGGDPDHAAKRMVRAPRVWGWCSRYRWGEPTDHGHHYHLIDVDSGKVIEFEDAAHERLVQEIAARLGFSLIGQRLELFGRKPKGEALARQRDTDGEG